MILDRDLRSCRRKLYLARRRLAINDENIGKCSKPTKDGFCILPPQVMLPGNTDWRRKVFAFNPKDAVLIVAANFWTVSNCKAETKCKHVST